MILDTIKVLVVDDQAVIRSELRKRIELEPRMEVIGEAANGIEAIEMARLFQPDLVIMDIEMPVLDGITSTAAIMEISPGCIVIALSAGFDPLIKKQAINAGATVFVEKQRVDRLFTAIHSAINLN